MLARRHRHTADYQPCTQPLHPAARRLTDGDYTFRVRATDAATNPDPSPATEDFTVDTAAPDTQILTHPADPTSSTDAHFTFSGSDPGGSGVASFECKLDSGAFAACTTPRDYSSLSEGSHTFSVRAIDQAGNPDASPDSFTWTVDTSAPETTIDTHPADPTSSTDAHFTFSGSDPGGSGVASFECKLDSGAFAACTTPRDYSSLSEGSHTFSVRAIDNAGNPDASPDSFTWTVDTSAPETTIDSAPHGTTNDPTPSFTFHSSEPGSSFECSLDTGTPDFHPCSSPFTPSALTDGDYSFRVRATDAAANPDPSPATEDFTVSTTLPDTVIDSAPHGSTSDPTPSFTFHSTKPGSTFACSLDQGTADYQPCTSPFTQSPALTDGDYTFRVRATDAATNPDPSPATEDFTVDTAAPDTQILTHPADPTSSTDAHFTFSGSDPGGSGVASFECKLDSGAFAACTTPRDYSSLSEGSHTFSVRAIDQAGNPDASPDSFTWTVDTSAPETTIDSAPHGTTNDPTPSFTFHSSEPGSSFECSLDTGTPDFHPCSSPFTPSALTDGDYSFRVRATDAAANPDPSPATEDFTVSTTLPDTVIDSAPHGSTSDPTPSFTFHSTKPGSTFACSLDQGTADYQPCTSPFTQSPALTDGDYTFRVRATDAATNPDPSPATEDFTVDTAAPDTQILTHPADPTSSTDAHFTFSGSDPGGSGVASFECKLDSGAFAACTTPRDYSSLSEGSHTFSVRAIDQAGNPDASPDSFTWTVDTSAPETTIDTHPADPTSSTDAHFTFSGSDPGGSGVASFECKLDSGAFAACTTPRDYSSLSEGSHTFSVRAIDNAGNPDASPDSFTWTVDTSAPETTIDSAPHGTTNDPTPSFTFHSSEPGSSFECSLDTGTPDFHPCTSPFTRPRRSPTATTASGCGPPTPPPTPTRARRPRTSRSTPRRRTRQSSPRPRPVRRQTTTTRR